MRRQAFILFFVTVSSCLAQVSAQMNGTGDLSHPTVDELHQKLSELVSRFKADEDEKRKNAEKAKVKGDKPAEGPSDEFRIVLERGGKRTALDRDHPVVLEEIIMKLSGTTVVAIELRFEEAAMRRQFSHKRSIKNDDIKKTTYGHITTYYHAEGDLDRSCETALDLYRRSPAWYPRSRRPGSGRQKTLGQEIKKRPEYGRTHPLGLCRKSSQTRRRFLS
jgi:hypothetical protein